MIRLTHKADGMPMLLNPAYIVAVFINDGRGTFISTVSEASNYFVKETVDEVFALIRAEQKTADMGTP